MNRTAFQSFWTVAVYLGASISMTEFAFAGPYTVAVPGPIAGVGLPVAGVVLGSYWLVRKLRNRK